MAKLNWSGDRSRRRQRARGTEAAADTLNLDDDSLAALLAGSPYRPLGRNAPSKAELRREAAALIHTGDPITLIIRCPCGRAASISVPVGRKSLKLRCTECDRLIERKV